MESCWVWNATHSQCQRYKKTGNPAGLTKVREINGQFVVNQTTIQLSNSNVTFTITPSSSSPDWWKQSSPAVAATNILLNQLTTLTRNLRVNVKGFLTLGEKHRKQLPNRSGRNGIVKKDCIIEVANGNTVTHVWENMIEKLQKLEKSNCKKQLRQHHVGNNSIHNIWRSTVCT